MEKPSNRFIIKSLPSLKDAKAKLNREVVRNKYTIYPRLKEFAIGKKYFIYTHGCQANIRDSETYAGILEEIGFTFTNDVNDASVVVFVTCAVRENAENKVFGEIGNLKKNRDLIIALTSCMSNEESVVNRIINLYPFIDIILGTHDIDKFPEALLNHIESNKSIIDVHSGAGQVIEGLPCVRKNKFKAFVNITYGCDNFCTYCIVPFTRGRQRSRDKEDIINECKELVAQGYQEITLLGQNVDTYGNDLTNKIPFSELLDNVAALNIPRLSFLTSHPYYFSLDIIDVMKKHSNIIPYIHLPIQSGDDHILKLMGRKYNSNQYLELIKNIRNIAPNVAIATDVIVGFPGETDEEFENSLKVIKECNFDAAFTFIYSKRNGTPAALIDDKVSYQEKVKRFKKLVATLEISIENNNKKYLNNTYDVLVDSISKNNANMLTGRLPTNKIVNFKGTIDLVGKIVKVKINSSHLHFLIGEMV